MLVNPKNLKDNIKYADGLFETKFPFNGHLEFNDLDLTFEQSYPEFNHETKLYDSFGVIDSPEQFIRKFGETLEKDERKFVVMFTHVAKDPEKRYGWRWRKWGKYHGNGKPTTEYLDDEEKFHNGVYTFRIFDLTDVKGIT